MLVTTWSGGVPLRTGLRWPSGGANRVGVDSVAFDGRDECLAQATASHVAIVLSIFRADRAVCGRMFTHELGEAKRGWGYPTSA